VAATASAAVFGAKGGAFSAGGEVLAATAVNDEAGTVSRRLREASLQLNQVSCCRLLLWAAFVVIVY
jgi:hypothetical protein